MRKRTVRVGLNHLFAAMVVITVATFFHGEVADLLLMSTVGETWFTIAGFITGGLVGGLGVLIVALGFIQAPALESDVHLKPMVVILAAIFLLFMFLFYSSFTKPSQQLQPGETITI